MGGISIWQLLIILLIIGISVAMYFIISGGSKGDIQRPLKFFHWSFWISVIGTVLLFVMVGAANDSDSGAAVLAPLFLVLTLAGWSYLIALGILARRTGGSWILWTGLTFITSPVGTIVSYLMMSSRANSLVAKLSKESDPDGVQLPHNSQT